MDLYERLDKITPNALIVRDGVIDWYFDRILPMFEDAGYELFIIGFNVSQEMAIKLIRARGDTPTVSEERFYALLKDHKIHIQRFRKIYTPDIIPEDSNLFDHETVSKRLNEKRAALK